MKARGQTSAVSLFYGFYHMVSGEKRDSEIRDVEKSRPGRTDFTFYLQVTFD